MNWISWLLLALSVLIVIVMISEVFKSDAQSSRKTPWMLVLVLPYILTVIGIIVSMAWLAVIPPYAGVLLYYFVGRGRLHA